MPRLFTPARSPRRTPPTGEQGTPRQRTDTDASGTPSRFNRSGTTITRKDRRTPRSQAGRPPARETPDTPGAPTADTARSASDQAQDILNEERERDQRTSFEDDFIEIIGFLPQEQREQAFSYFSVFRRLPLEDQERLIGALMEMARRAVGPLFDLKRQRLREDTDYTVGGLERDRASAQAKFDELKNTIDTNAVRDKAKTDRALATILSRITSTAFRTNISGGIVKLRGLMAMRNAKIKEEDIDVKAGQRLRAGQLALNDKLGDIRARLDRASDLYDRGEFDLAQKELAETRSLFVDLAANELEPYGDIARRNITASDVLGGPGGTGMGGYSPTGAGTGFDTVDPITGQVLEFGGAAADAAASTNIDFTGAFTGGQQTTAPTERVPTLGDFRLTENDANLFARMYNSGIRSLQDLARTPGGTVLNRPFINLPDGTTVHISKSDISDKFGRWLEFRQSDPNFIPDEDILTTVGEDAGFADAYMQELEARTRLPITERGEDAWRDVGGFDYVLNLPIDEHGRRYINDRSGLGEVYVDENGDYLTRGGRQGADTAMETYNRWKAGQIPLYPARNSAKDNTIRQALSSYRSIQEGTYGNRDLEFARQYIDALNVQNAPAPVWTTATPQSPVGQDIQARSAGRALERATSIKAQQRDLTPISQPSQRYTPPPQPTQRYTPPSTPTPPRTVSHGITTRTDASRRAITSGTYRPIHQTATPSTPAGQRIVSNAERRRRERQARL